MPYFLLVFVILANDVSIFDKYHLCTKLPWSTSLKSIVQLPTPCFYPASFHHEATFAEYFPAAWSNNELFSCKSTKSGCSGAIASKLDVCSLISLPEITFNTIEFAVASTSFGYFCTACCSAASASGSRPRCSSATAWLTSDLVAEVEGAWAISSKT